MKIIILVAAAVVALVLLRKLGYRKVSFLALIGAFAVLPGSVYGEYIGYVGIAPGSLQIMTYMLAISFSILLVKFRNRLDYWLIIALFAYLLVLTPTLWKSENHVWFGTLLFLFCGASYLIGTRFADFLVEPEFRRFWIGVLFAGLAVQLATAVLQLLGLPIFAMDAETAAYMGSRVNGTFNHPTALGKMVLVVLLLSLPFWLDRDKVIRWLTWGSLAIGILLLILSGGRANLLAGFMMLGIWFLLNLKQINRGLRIAGAVALSLGGLAGLWVIIKRFQEDPEGGARGRLLETALENMNETFVFGVGPNGYVAHFGQFDDLTAMGWVVHNYFVLSLAELGLIGSTIFLGLMAFVFVRSLEGAIRLRDSLGLQKAFLCFVPGFLLVGWTGWGFMHQYNLPFLLFALGVVAGTLTISNKHREESLPEKLAV